MNPEIKQAGSSLILLQPELSKFNQFEDCSSSVLAEVMHHALWRRKKTRRKILASKKENKVGIHAAYEENGDMRPDVQVLHATIMT